MDLYIFRPPATYQTARSFKLHSNSQRIILDSRVRGLILKYQVRLDHRFAKHRIVFAKVRVFTSITAPRKIASEFIHYKSFTFTPHNPSSTFFFSRSQPIIFDHRNLPTIIIAFARTEGIWLFSVFIIGMYSSTLPSTHSLDPRSPHLYFLCLQSP